MTRRTRHTFGLMVDLALLGASLTIGGPIPDAVRAIGIIVCAVCGSLVIFAATVLTIGIVTTVRQPPYEG
jgi:hypothetical protein